MMLIASIILLLVTIIAVEGLVTIADPETSRPTRIASAGLTAVAATIAVAVFTVPALGVVS